MILFQFLNMDWNACDCRPHWSRFINFVSIRQTIVPVVHRLFSPTHPTATSLLQPYPPNGLWEATSADRHWQLFYPTVYRQLLNSCLSFSTSFERSPNKIFRTKYKLMKKSLQADLLKDLLHFDLNCINKVKQLINLLLWT